MVYLEACTWIIQVTYVRNGLGCSWYCSVLSLWPRLQPLWLGLWPGVLLQLSLQPGLCLFQLTFIWVSFVKQVICMPTLTHLLLSVLDMIWTLIWISFLCFVFLCVCVRGICLSSHFSTIKSTKNTYFIVDYYLVEIFMYLIYNQILYRYKIDKWLGIP